MTLEKREKSMKDLTDHEIHSLIGNQPRIALLYLNAKSFPYDAMVRQAIDVAISYAPDSGIKSF